MTGSTPGEDIAAGRAATQLGERLRSLRKKKVLTITQLSLYTGLSVGFLSNMENGISSPTVANLTKVCNALNVSILDVLGEGDALHEIVRDGEAEIIDVPESSMKMKIVDFGANHRAFSVITIEPHARRVDAVAMHPYDEAVYVMRGELAVTIEERRFELSRGDSLFIQANCGHTIENDGTDVSESIWFAVR
ncbi:helix-turn-helix domain protein [Coriobacterium glomerans PW2]|uniref:Helix-turn-helix domain protein n=2 Tax=Coriobacterium TaxID=33870 RepID=F2N9W9_CORGP|nr:helix-turn-helix domain protein [Coriobacterium glomerans PW2]